MSKATRPVSSNALLRLLNVCLRKHTAGSLRELSPLGCAFLRQFPFAGRVGDQCGISVRMLFAGIASWMFIAVPGEPVAAGSPGLASGA